MTLKNNLKVRFKSIAYSFGAIATTILFYDPIYNFVEKAFRLNTDISATITASFVSVAYTVILAILIDPLLNLVSNGDIVEDELVWTKDGNKIELLEYPIRESLENSICPVSVTVKCTPKRMWLFSFLRFMGFGILLYGSGNGLAFTKSNSSDSQRYRVLNNKQVFISSFYVASNEDRGNIWNINFDIKLLDSTTQNSYIYAGFGFGSKKHKIRARGLLMNIIAEPLKIEIVGNVGE